MAHDFNLLIKPIFSPDHRKHSVIQKSLRLFLSLRIYYTCLPDSYRDKEIMEKRPKELLDWVCEAIRRMLIAGVRRP